MLKKIILAAGVTLGLMSGAQAAGEAIALPKQDWSFYGIFGTYDRAQAQRGFQVYKEVCAACHALHLVSYRNLQDLGFSEEEVKAIAANYKVTDGPNDAGEMFERAARPSDKFVSPFPNENAARASNNGAYPPDLSLIAKARVGGPDYLYALLTGYEKAPADVQLLDGQYYNKYFPGHKIAMPQPLNDGQVTFADGTQASVSNMARDLTVFLNWAAEPELERRHRLGVQVILFLIVATGFFYAAKRRVWADVH
ncbi:cytochrome c1 [Elstera cyanobacteriorum]|uniref:Cytochrome c1 n=1 Tax=Elstera cyanobacteriorum TaxID=2022747 RepID=A0A255XIR2_9PROT|nr:cytochrome c1 [Elstera cyanobacteriorum]MCK6442985.1 cytochrome c1 [Elstera cyanobacteriorum]OYQ16847.1 cytochrome c1 [Elstera cyanobacteriorum]GFZ88965.1 cytochrome c [Elstera cyanobacteriorum]